MAGLVALVTGCAAVAGFWLAQAVSHDRRKSQTVEFVSRKPFWPGYSVPPFAERGNRIVYPHSVIPGGIGSAEELRLYAARDGAVAEHYRRFRYGAARMVRLDAERRAYVSYRNKHGIFWTRKKVLLKKGELLITDGRTLVRTRCGNQVCETPQTPVAMVDEPSWRELDTPAPAAWTPAPEMEPFLADLAPLASEETARPAAPYLLDAPMEGWLHPSRGGTSGGAGGAGGAIPGGSRPVDVTYPPPGVPGDSTLPSPAGPQPAPVPEAGGELVLLPGNQQTNPGTPGTPGTPAPSAPVIDEITYPPNTQVQPAQPGTGGGSGPGKVAPWEQGPPPGPQAPAVPPTGELVPPPAPGGNGGGVNPAPESVVPEPSTLLLVSLGALLIPLRLLWRRSRDQSAPRSDEPTKVPASGSATL